MPKSPDLTPDERQQMREWLKHPMTERLMEWAEREHKARLATVRTELRYCNLTTAAAYEGEMKALEDVLKWPEHLLEVKPRRGEDA